MLMFCLRRFFRLTELLIVSLKQSNGIPFPLLYEKIASGSDLNETLTRLYLVDFNFSFIISKSLISMEVSECVVHVRNNKKRLAK